jgi:hypothetical protein
LAGRIGSIEKASDLFGNQTHDLSACSVVPQPTTLPFAVNFLPWTIIGIDISYILKEIKKETLTNDFSIVWHFLKQLLWHFI